MCPVSRLVQPSFGQASRFISSTLCFSPVLKVWDFIHVP